MMGGFKNELNNIAFEDGLFNLIILHLYQSSHNMMQDCILSKHHLYNHEDRITDRLIDQHLNFNNLGLRFISQSPETFISTEDQYRGRCDIKVVSNNWFIDINDYYLIECKRIDGENHLNRQYVLEGVSRFVVAPSKYPSHHKRNIMLGYVVKVVDIPNNTSKIEKLQCELLPKVIPTEFSLRYNENAEFYHYGCTYQSDAIGSIELAHLFYDFSRVTQCDA